MFAFIGTAMQMVGYVAIGIGVLFVIFRLVNRKAGESWWHLLRSKLGKSGDYAKNIDPAGQMRQAAQDAAADLKQADAALEANEALKLKLERQIQSDSQQAGRLRVKVKQLIEQGRPDSDPEVIAKAARIADLEKSVAQNQSQVEEQAKIYKNVLSSADKSAKSIRKAMEEAKRMEVDLKMGEQMVNLSSMLQRYDPTAVNSKMAKIDEYRQAAQDMKDGHAAKLKVMADRSASFVAEDDTDDDVATDEVNSVLASIRSGGPAKV